MTHLNGYTVHHCAECGHGWVSSPVQDAEIRKFYESDEAVRRQYEFPEKVVRKQARRLFEFMAAAGLVKGQLVDLGCGQGIHVEVAREQGWNAVGVDHSEESRKLCRRRGAEVYESLESLEKEKGLKCADLITLWETLEHLRDPGETLARVRALLKPGGIIALSTPNFGSAQASAEGENWHEILPPMHLQYFTPRSLEIFLKKNGFENIHILTFGAWSSVIDGIGSFLLKLGLPERPDFLFKVACYKFGKPYFDRALQRKRKGCGLLAFASAGPVSRPFKFREFF